MRSNITLLEGFEDIKTLQQYLYMSEDHHIRITNCLNVPLELRMDEQCQYWCQNLHFPELPETNWSSNMTIETMLDIIYDLQNTPATEFPDRFKNRWEEIKTLTRMTVAVNKQNKKR